MSSMLYDDRFNDSHQIYTAAKNTTGFSPLCPIALASAQKQNTTEA